jgi:hypothetical protein
MNVSINFKHIAEQCYSSHIYYTYFTPTDMVCFKQFSSSSFLSGRHGKPLKTHVSRCKMGVKTNITHYSSLFIPLTKI